MPAGTPAGKHLNGLQAQNWLSSSGLRHARQMGIQGGDGDTEGSHPFTRYGCNESQIALDQAGLRARSR